PGPGSPAPGSPGSGSPGSGSPGSGSPGSGSPGSGRPPAGPGGAPRRPDAPRRRDDPGGPDDPRRPRGAAERRTQRPPGTRPGASAGAQQGRGNRAPDPTESPTETIRSQGRGRAGTAVAAGVAGVTSPEDGGADSAGPTLAVRSTPGAARTDGPSGTSGDRSTGADDGPARRTLGAALGVTAASTLVPGSGHLLLGRRRTGGLVLTVFLLVVAALLAFGFTARRTTLLETALSTTFLTIAAVGVLLAALAWIAIIARTYALARPRVMPTAQKIIGTGCAALLCMTVAVPFGFAADLANSQRTLLNTVFGGEGGGTSVADAIAKPRLNVLLLGSDAGEGRTGTRTDTMMVASIDTRSGRTTLFGLPRNIQRAEFPPDSPMAKKFPNGFHDPKDPLSGNYLLNAVYAYAEADPAIAPSGPTSDPGLNLLQSSISYMTGLPIDYYLEINMAGFSSLIDAVGGVTVDVGPDPIPINGVTANGQHVRPDGYIQPGVQTLNGEDALWFARSRRDSNDYQRMGRQRCLIQAVLTQKSPADLLTRFQDVAQVATDNIDTNLPQQVLPQLVSLAGDGFSLESVSFDPNLPDPNENDGKFNTSRPDVDYMREVVQAAIDGVPLPGSEPSSSAAPSSTTRSGSASASASAGASAAPQAETAAPQSLADSCAAVSAGDTAGDLGPGN
ncbi:MAG: LCP family protein, partial [Pseudonocardia sp.]|nr:LCP family protein [Pseudonocardia sp.]